MLGCSQKEWMRRNLLRLSALMLLALCLAGCGRSESYRYKLTVAVDTSEGTKRASNVVEVRFTSVRIPAQGVMHDLNGEALYVDLGKGRRPLIVLLSKRFSQRRNGEVRWSRDGGPNNPLLAEFCGDATARELLDLVQCVSKTRGSHRISLDDVPDLVTFANIDKPDSVVLVDPHDLAATFGSDVTWNAVTLEITDEPVTRNINKKLPWLRDYFERNRQLDGADGHFKNEPANILSWSDFELSRDLKRTRQPE